MRFILGFLAGAVCLAQGTQSVVLNGTNQAISASIPNASPYSAVTAMRVEFRLTNFALSPASREEIFDGGGNFLVYIAAGSNNLSLTDFFESGSPTSNVSLAGRTDVIVRLTKIPGADEIVEIWDANGANYVQSCTPGGTAGTCPQVDTASRNWGGNPIVIGSHGSGNWLNAQLAYFRWYSSTVPVGFLESLPPNNVAGGDLLDLEFEGNLNDSSAHADNASRTGSPTYTTTAYYAYLPFSFSAQSGSSFTINGAGSAASSYSWKQTAGSGCTLTHTTSAAVTVAGCTGFGQRTFQLAATSATSQNATATINVGVVQTDASGVVQVGDSNWAWMLGPMTIASTVGTTWSPWSWFETQRVNLSSYWYSDPNNAPGGAWPTSMVASEENLLYYCSICSLYRQYFRTGLTQYQTWARSLAATVYAYSDGWNNGSPSGGCASNWVAPRDSTAEGIIMWLYDTGGSLSPSSCVQQYVDWEFSDYLEQRDITHGFQGPYFGIRESGYAYNMAVMLSVVSNVDVNSHGLWTTRIANEFTNYWSPYQCPSVYNNGCGKISTQIAGTVALTNGNPSIVGTGTSFTTAFAVGAVRAVVSYGGSGYKSPPTVTSPSYAGASFTAVIGGGQVTAITINSPGVPTSSNFVQNLVITGGGGSGATAYTEAGHIWIDNNATATCSSLNIDAGWAAYPITAITDNTHMTLQNAPSNTSTGCVAYADSQGAANDFGSIRWSDQWPGYMEQPWHYSIGAEGIARLLFHPTITAPPGVLTYLENAGNELANQEYFNIPCAGVTVRSVFYAQYGAGPFGAGCSTALDVHGSRAQENTVFHIYGWLYRLTGNSTWLKYGDNYFSADFGDSGTGNGTDGLTGQFDIPYGSKFYGQSLRSADSYLANRLKPQTGFGRAFLFAVSPADDPGAPEVQIALTGSDGNVSSNTCTASPCGAMATASGPPQVQIQYFELRRSVMGSTGSSPISLVVQ